MQAMYYWTVECVHGWSRIETHHQTNTLLSAEDAQRWDAVIQRLRAGEPIQYILGRAAFMDMTLFVSPAVLIPRPETEELVALMLKHHNHTPLCVLDVGTGSGCIAIALKRMRPAWKVAAIDISQAALQVAMDNARQLQLDIDFFQADVLSSDFRFPALDIVVSNPPYIPEHLSLTIEHTVRDFEPHLALFSPADRPFVFYERIVELSKMAGVKDLWFEIHHSGSDNLQATLAASWSGELQMHRDISGHMRILRLVAPTV